MNMWLFGVVVMVIWACALVSSFMLKAVEKINPWVIGCVAVLVYVTAVVFSTAQADGINNLPYQPMIIDPEEAPHYYYYEHPCGEPDTYSAPHGKVHKNDIAIPEPRPFYLLIAGGVVYMGWRRL